MDVFLEEPNMGEFVIWGLTDAHSWLDEQQGKTEGLLYDKQYKPKPAYDSIMVSLNAHPASEVITPYKLIHDTTTTDTTTTDTTKTDTTAQDTSKQALAYLGNLQGISMSLAGRTLTITGAVTAKVELFDMQGRPVFSAKNVKGSVELQGVSEGLYVIRVRNGSAKLIQRFMIK